MAVAAAAIALVVPAVSFDLRASRAFNAGPGVGPMSIVVRRRKVIGKWSPHTSTNGYAIGNGAGYSLQIGDGNPLYFLA